MQCYYQHASNHTMDTRCVFGHDHQVRAHQENHKFSIFHSPVLMYMYYINGMNIEQHINSGGNIFSAHLPEKVYLISIASLSSFFLKQGSN